MGKYRVCAFDLDGTLTEHKSPLSPENRAVLDALSRKYRLLMVGAGTCTRIFRQMGEYPIDIIGNYGMQKALYDREAGTLRQVRADTAPVDRESIDRRTAAFREKYGFTEYAGKSVEYHPSGCVTIALLGTEAALTDKLAFDPDHKKRAAVYADVCALFPEYTVFIGGSSSFDMAPRPYDKAYALTRFCEEEGYKKDEILYAGDDYLPGGNDESVLRAGFDFVRVDDYRKFPELMRPYMKSKIKI